MSVAAWTAVASSIVAAVSLCVAAGSFLVAWKAWRRDELAVRRDVLRRLVGNAYRLTQKWQGQEGESFVALNEAFIVYADFPRVTSALESMRNELGRDGRLSLNLVTVVMAMADAAKVPVKSLDEEVHQQPVCPGRTRRSTRGMNREQFGVRTKCALPAILQSSHRRHER